MSSSTDNDSHYNDDENIEFQDSIDLPNPSNPKKRRAHKQFITANMVAILDRCKISDRDSVRIIAAVAEALGHDLGDLIINRSSIRRCRTQLRAEFINKFREASNAAKLDAITVHWDEKLLPSLKWTEKVERLAVLITCKHNEILLGIPIIPSSSGNDQATAVYDLLEEYGLCDKVQAFCCDTISTNTGRFKGACIILEQKLERDILYLLCRHHIYEIILQSIFSEKMIKSTGPNVTLFKRFQEVWLSINKTHFVPGINDKIIRQTIENDVIEDIIKFSKELLAKNEQPREDYKELLQLIIVFLGGTSQTNISFRAPGAFHHARWMAKAIYALKIYLFRDQFSLSIAEDIGIRDICIFLVKVYVKAWFRAPVASEAPRQDLEFLQKLYAYRKIDNTISRIALHKFCNHLWYLTPEMAALAFFDKLIGKETKLKMVEAIKNKPADEVHKKFKLVPEDVKTYMDRGIDYFISEDSKRFFERFSISMEFLEKDPDIWEHESNFNYG